MIMLNYVIPIFNSGNKIQILPLNYNPTTCLNLSTAADVYSVVRHIVRRESSTLDILGLYQQAYGSPPINQLRNCSPQTNYSLVEHFRNFVTRPRTFSLRRTMFNRSADILLRTISV